MTEKYPDLVALIPHIQGPGTENFIMEGEIVPVDEQGSVKPFQTLAARGKKNVSLSEVKVQVCLYAFDLMYLNGEVRHRRAQADNRVYWPSLSGNVDSYCGLGLWRYGIGLRGLNRWTQRRKTKILYLPSLNPLLRPNVKESWSKFLTN